MANQAMQDLPAVHESRRRWRTAIITMITGRTLEACVESGRDNILQLRLMAALMVVLGHSNIGGPGSIRYDPVNYFLPHTWVHPIGLMIFFTISGFLISLSFVRRPQLLRFLRARALRLWPALIVCLVLCAFVLGPWLTSVPLHEYFSTSRPDNPYLYVAYRASMLKGVNELPGLFRTTTSVAPGAVNTPLWSLVVEATMYLWVAGAGVLRLFRFPWLTSIGIATLFSVTLLWPMIQGIAPPYVLMIEGFFGAGAIACLLRRHIPVSTGLMLLLAAACFAARNSVHATPFTWLAVAYFVFWFSYVPRLPPMPYQADLSYGAYIWAWPVQQTVVLLTHLNEPLYIFAITLIFLLPISAASWFFIEKPALRLKDRRRFRTARRDLAESVAI